jgi:hypothetical protein
VKGVTAAELVEDLMGDCLREPERDFDDDDFDDFNEPVMIVGSTVATSVQTNFFRIQVI